jgi:RNA polymerase sigma factor (sigma-70 family)
MTDLVLDNIGLALRQSRRIGYANIQDDLDQAATEGLIQAAKKYDPSRGTFGNYSYLWIKQALQRELCRAQPVKMSDADFLANNKIHATISTLMGRNEETTNEAIALEGGLDERLVELLVKYRTPLSVDWLLTEGDPSDPTHIVEEVLVEDNHANLEVEELMEDLLDEQVVMMTWRMLGYKNVEIARLMGLGERYVSDHLQKATAQLKEEHGQA